MAKIGKKAVATSMLIAFVLVSFGSTSVTGAKRFAGTEIELSALNLYDLEVLKQMLPRFEKETGIKVQVVLYPYAQLRDTQIMGLLSGTGKPDVVNLDTIWLGEYVSKDWLYPLDDFIKRDAEELMMSDMPPRLRNESSWEGKFYAFPVLSTVSILFYRKSMFDQAGFAPAETHEDMIKIGKHFTRAYNPDSPTPYGLLLRYRAPHHIVADWVPFLWAFGSDMFDENWKPILNNEQGIAATDLHLGLFVDHGIVPPGAINYGHDEVVTSFQQGQAAMLFTETYTIGRVTDPQATAFSEDMVLAPIPGHRDPKTGELNRGAKYGGLHNAINKDSKNIEAAWELVKFIHTRENQREFVDRGGCPHYWFVMKDPYFVEKYPWFPSVEQSFKTMMSRPRIPEWIEIEYYTGMSLSAALTGIKSTNEALDEIAAKLSELMEKGGYYR